MGFQFRKRIHIWGPIYINLSKSGMSTSIKEGPFSWNSKRGKSVDLPGGLSWRENRRGRRRG